MFDWQLVFILELFVVLCGFGIILWAANAAAGPRTFARVVAIIVIVLATLLAICTLTKAVIYALRGDEPEMVPVYFWGYDQDSSRPAKPPAVASSPSARDPAPRKDPIPEYKGDLRKKKWHERGEMLKKKWAERGG
jgi:hypothetical protein